MTAQPTRILAVEDERDFARTLSGIFSGYNCQISSCGTGNEAVQLMAAQSHDAVILDLGVPGLPGIETMREIRHLQPDIPVLVLNTDDRVDAVVEAMKLGAYDYLTKPVEWQKLATSLRQALLQRGERNGENKAYCFERLIGESHQMQNVIRSAERIIDTHAPVLITGEHGTGKELLARMIHSNGPRKNGPFVAVHCASVGAEQLEKEVFGHEKSFGGSVSIRPGRVEHAAGGTLYLDEIAEMPPQTQIRFLHMLHEQRFQRVGGTQNLASDIRIISASHTDLGLAMRKGAFRQDLYYGVAVYPITLPPLRERPRDIPLLAGFFMQQFNQEYGRDLKTILPQTLEILACYSWPGNVRELRSLLVRSFLNAPNTSLEPSHLPARLTCGPNDSNRAKPVEPIGVLPAADRIVPLKLVEKEVLVRALKLANYNMSSAASALGIGRTTLYRKLQKYRIELRR